MQKLLVYGMTQNTGGIENYILNLMDELGSSVPMDFVTHFSKMAYEDRVKALGCNIFYIPGKSQGLWKHMKGFWKFLEENPEYKKIYFNVMDTKVVITVLLCKLGKRKVIVHSHNGDVDKSRVHRLCRWLLNRLTDIKMACSNSAAVYMFGDKYATDTVIIHNKIDVDKYRYNPRMRKNKRKELSLETEFVVCHVGRITEQKNPIGLVYIFEEIVKMDLHVKLLYVGTGDMEKEVKDLVTKVGLEDKVMFLGVRHDVPEIMQAADVFLLPSFYEGLPIVGVEAQAAGLPCVFSDAITTETAISDNVTFLSLEETKEAWAKAVLQWKNFDRKDMSSVITEQGYNLHVPKDRDILLKCLKN